MKGEDKTSRPLVPVAWEHLEDVRALLERLEARDSAHVDGVEESRTEKVRRIFDGCSPSTQRMLLYMAEKAEERPGEPCLGKELVRAANPEGPEGGTNISPYLKSLNSTTAKLGLWEDIRLVDVSRPGPDRLFRFRMSPEDAEIVRGFAG
jgi:hypothetical protein